MRIVLFILVLAAYNFAIQYPPLHAQVLRKGLWYFVAGCVFLIFIEGPRIGIMEPESTRWLMVVVGAGLVLVAFWPLLEW